MPRFASRASRAKPVSSRRDREIAARLWRLAAERLKSYAHERDNMNILRVTAIGPTAFSWGGMRSHTTELDKHEDRKLSSMRRITLLRASGYSTPTAERSRIEM